MREFIVIGHSAIIDSDFSLDDITGAAGRLDVLCRCVNSAFFLSHGFRHSVTVHLVLQDTMTIRLVGDALRNLHPDERNIAAAIRNAIAASSDAVGHQEAASAPGIYTANYGLETLLDSFSATRLVPLLETGTRLPEATLPQHPVFVLSDHQDFTEAEHDHFDELPVQPVRVGPRALHADHTITIVHNYLDTNGYTEY